MRIVDTTEHQRAEALAATEAGRLAEAYRLWLPLAEAGDADAQCQVGSMMLFSLHRFESYEQLNAGTGPTVDEATSHDDREAGVQFLKAASAAGIGAASFNLAGLYVDVSGDGSWEERKAKAAELYALAYSQGFTVFGWLMQGEGPGQPYLDLMERHMLSGDQSPPPEWWSAKPCNETDGGA